MRRVSPSSSAYRLWIYNIGRDNERSAVFYGRYAPAFEIRADASFNAKMIALWLTIRMIDEETIFLLHKAAVVCYNKSSIHGCGLCKGCDVMNEKNMDVIRLTMENLRRNNMAAYYVETKDEVPALVRSLMHEGETVTHGGSESLRECGVIDMLNSGVYDYTYVDRSAAKDREEGEALMRKAYTADTYLASANAVTEGGLLFNVDGNSNRVSAILYGPKQVIFICGYQKIVKDLDAAVYRLKTVAAPKNTRRLHCETYCAQEGECLAKGRDASYMCDGCKSPARICCNYVVSAYQRHKDRFKVIIVGEKLGY